MTLRSAEWKGHQPVITPDVPTVVTDTVLLATYHDLDWVGGELQVWRGSPPPSEHRVSSACIFLITSDNTLLLVNVRKRTWDLPGGHTEDGETIMGTLQREILEEAGLTPEHYTRPTLLGWFLVLPTDEPVTTMLVYTANITTLPETLVTQMPDEISDVQLFPLNILPADTKEHIWQPYVKHLATEEERESTP